MTDATRQTADRDRRRLVLGAGTAALTLGTTGAAEAGTPRPTTPTWAITRTRYGTAATAFLPTTGDTYVLPLAVVVATDRSNDAILDANNTITINTAGNYRITIAVDWSPGKGRDIDLRTAGLRLRPAGLPPIVAAPGGALTKIADTDTALCSEDMPGAAVPVTVRLPAPPKGAKDITWKPFPWNPGTIPVGGSATIDVTMPLPGIVAPGDAVLASHTLVTDAAVGVTAATSLILRATPIAQDTVRVAILNPFVSPSVTIPDGGDLYLLGMSTTQITGGSGEARTVMTTTTLGLNAGDTVYGILRSLAPGDALQSTAEVYVEVTRFVQTS